MLKNGTLAETGATPIHLDSYARSTGTVAFKQQLASEPGEAVKRPAELRRIERKVRHPCARQLGSEDFRCSRGPKRRRATMAVHYP